MTRNEIISRLGWLHFSHIDGSPDSVLSRIEKLVADVEAAEREAMLDRIRPMIVQAEERGAKEEREACAQLMEVQHIWITNISAGALIRARGAA